MRHRLVTTVAILLLAGRAAAVDVTTCGQVVGAGEHAALATDLTCTPTDAFTYDFGVRLGAGASLDLAGHRIEMVHDGGNLAGVDCQGRCRVLSSSPTPGEIAGIGPLGGYSAGIFVGLGGGAVVRNLSVEGFSSGVYGTGRSLSVSSVTASNNPQHGLYCDGRLKAKDVSASGNGSGLTAKRIVGKRLQVTANSSYGLFSNGSVRGSEIEVTGSTIGIYSFDGDAAGSIVLESSQATGNTLDLLSGRRPRLVDSTCDTSENGGTSQTWGICAND